MTISIQTLQDVLVAFGTVAGIAVAFTAAILAAGAIFRRDQAHMALLPVIPPGRPASPADGVRELIAS